MKLTELLQKAAIRSGIQTDEGTIAYIASLEGSDMNIEVPDTLATGVSSLMSEADAKVNPAVKSHFVRATLDTMDNKLAEFAESVGLSPEQVEALKSEKNTFNKPDLLKNAITEHLKNAGKKTDSPEAKKIIEELEAKLTTLATEKATEIQRIQSEFETERVNNAINAQFSNYQWSEAFAPTLRPTVINTVLQQELAAVGAKIKRNSNGEIELVNANDETLPFRQNNEQVAFNQFADGLMAKHNLIKTTPAAGATPPATSITTAAAPAPATKSNHLNRLMQDNLQQLEGAAKQ